MMKRYNRPEIEAIELKMLDVIALSGKEAVINELEAAGIPVGKVDELGDVFADVTTNTWSW